jgi:hypothetical protein
MIRHCEERATKQSRTALASSLRRLDCFAFGSQ